MKHYQFYLSYSSKDRAIAKIFIEKMEQAGYSVFDAEADVTAGPSFAEKIVKTISSCDNFILLLTRNTMQSTFVLIELTVAIERNKNVIPILLEALELSREFQYYLHNRALLTANGNDELSIQKAVDQIDQTYGNQLKRDALYEKLSEYEKIKDDNRRALTLTELIAFVGEEFERSEKNPTTARKLAKELYSLYESLSTFVGGYDQETKSVAKTVMERLHHAQGLFTHSIFQSDPFFAAVALSCIYFEYETAIECVDIRTGGDVRNPFPIERRIESQKSFLETYESYCDRSGELKQPLSTLTESEKELIRKTPAHIFAYKVVLSTKTPSQTKTEKSAEQPLDKDNEILLSVAEFMQKGNDLFNLLRQKGEAGDFLKCLLTSYERLKNYCMVVGANKVAAECVERIAEIRQELAFQAPSEAVDSKAENGIKSLLGITTAQSGSYDVFISFKSEDNDLAKLVYQFCKKNMIQAFWSKVSLPELSKSDYGNAIDEALDSAKHFVLVLSDLSYLESDWIKYEMSTFADEIREGRKEGANFVILATDNVYQSLIDSNKKLLPIKYRWCQILKLGEYEDTLLNYLK